MANNLHKNIDAYRTELEKCAGKKCESIFQKIADQYEDDLLEVENFPDEYFTFVLELLSNENFYSKKGLWNFLLVLGTEQGKLRVQHYQELAKCITNHYGRYLDEDLCLAVCDFIARNYSTTDAQSLFDKMALTENKKPEKLRGFVNDGLRILLAEDRRNRNKEIGSQSK
ncbi:hypothetical protein [Stenotrophobium rhamnosiphilum]|uniref:Uncharacterized protein n=1 Tax=Stenotrophobium rhamnosiphilum TaxID=2029166 RepID=A0A2T5MBA3_9GAMM|nr:hypothetical protein [Stenotrophobium rhamnosiphilum]PTU28293.1 hypothetical protein CJD38_17825 [Stenotrophobium rhamnosiphilum]